jgi:hypothetical protein
MIICFGIQFPQKLAAPLGITRKFSVIPLVLTVAATRRY